MRREARFLSAAWALMLGLTLTSLSQPSALTLAGANILCLLSAFLMCLIPAVSRTLMPIRRMRRPNLLAAMILTVAIAEGLVRLGQTPSVYPVAAGGVGLLLWAFWLRGPDGEPHALLLSGTGALAFIGLAALLPASQAWSLLTGAACGTLMLLHLAALRARPLPWASSPTQRQPRLPSRLS